MLYKLAHILRDHFPYIWNLIDILNSFLFDIRYGYRIKRVPLYNDSNYIIKPISAIGAQSLARFFVKQPENAYIHFKPHGFDVQSIEKLQRNKAFLAYVVMDGEVVVGYFFMRSFFWGKTFIGRIVDVDYRGKGVAKMMTCKIMEIASIIKLRVFSTIAPDNISSLKSSEAGCEHHIIKTMSNGDLLFEKLSKKS